jgi:hypothetical protein
VHSVLHQRAGICVLECGVTSLIYPPFYMQAENTVEPILRFAWRTAFCAVNQDKS